MFFEMNFYLLIYLFYRFFRLNFYLFTILLTAKLNSNSISILLKLALKIYLVVVWNSFFLSSSLWFYFLFDFLVFCIHFVENKTLNWHSCSNLYSRNRPLAYAIGNMKYRLKQRRIQTFMLLINIIRRIWKYQQFIMFKLLFKYMIYLLFSDLSWERNTFTMIFPFNYLSEG